MAELTIPYWEVVLRLVLAVLLCGAIGFEREVRDQPYRSTARRAYRPQGLRVRDHTSYEGQVIEVHGFARTRKKKAGA